MRLKLILQVVRTHLISRMRQTIIAALGVTFGIGLFIGMISFMIGLNRLFDDLMLNATPHVRLYNELELASETAIDQDSTYDEHMVIVRHQRPKDVQRKIRNAGAIIKDLKEDDRVYGVAPRVMTQAFYVFGATELNGSIVGIDPVEEDKLFKMSDYMVAGSLENLLTSRNGIIIGMGISEKLGVGVDDRIVVTTVAGVRRQLKIVGVFQIGISAIDDVQSYTSINMAQELSGKARDFITDINIKLYDIDQSVAMADELRSRYDISAIDYIEANAQMEMGMTARSVMTYIIGVALLIVAGFGIYNILNMFIQEKMDDIAILKATGFKGRDIQRIFIWEAMVIGCIGAISGLLIGYLISYGIDNIPFEQDFMPTLTTYPVTYEVQHYLIGFTFAIATTFLAGYLPSRKAGKVDPVDIIRGK